MVVQPAVGRDGERGRDFVMRAERHQVSGSAFERLGVHNAFTAERRHGSTVHRVDEVRDGRVEHRLADDRVTERGGAAARLQQTRPDAGSQRVGNSRVVGVGNGPHHDGVEVADHGARDHDLTLRLVEEHQTRVDEIANRARNLPRATAPRGTRVVDVHCSHANVPADELFDEQRHAVGACEDVGNERRRRVGVEERGDEVADGSFVERQHLDDVGETVAAQEPRQLVGVARLRRTHRPDEGEALDPCVHDVADGLQALGIYRMQVVGDQHGTVGRRDHRAKQLDDALQREEATLSGFELGGCRHDRPLGEHQPETPIERTHRIGHRVGSQP